MIRLATIGTSTITEHLLDALSRTPGVAFVGTCSRNAERAAAFSQEHGGTQSFSSIDELAASSDVDAVYIGSPNALHAPQALACIAGGKHVLVEKSFAANRREAADVFAAAEAAGVVALEAMRPVHDPAFQALRSALPELGPIRRATLRFGKYSARYNEILAGRRTNIFDCALASGSLMDIGVYTVEPLIELFGAPESIAAAAVLLDEETRALTNGPIDGAGVVAARYPGMVATLHHSKITNDLAESQIEGERGTLTIDEISGPTVARLDIRASREHPGQVGFSTIETTTQELALPRCENNMERELADFVAAIDAVQAGASPLDAAAGPFGTVRHFRDLTLDALALMDEARAQTGVAFPADEVRY